MGGEGGGRDGEGMGEIGRSIEGVGGGGGGGGVGREGSIGGGIGD